MNHFDDVELDEETTEEVDTVGLTEAQAQQYRLQKTLDAQMQDRRRAKLIALGATESQAATNCVDETSFIAMRVFLRGK
jgi:hypothetical protein